MIRNLKVLSLALVAAFSMSAMAASAASATSFWFTSDGDWTTLEGAQVGIDQWHFDWGTTSCNEATYHGSTGFTTTTEITLTPHYGDCTPILGSTTIDTNKCGYQFRTHTLTSGNYDTTFEIECNNVGEEMTITTFTNTKHTTLICTTHIPQQTIATGVSFTNNGSGTLTMVINIATGITYTQTSGSSLGKCPTTGLTHNGGYTAHALIEGQNTARAETSIGVS